MMRLLPRGTARGWPRLPRRTARLRLTALYGGLFLACGAVLLAVTYVLVEQAIDPQTLNLTAISHLKASSSLLPFRIDGRASSAGGLTPLEVTMGKAIAASDLRQVLIQAPIALAIVTVVALVLGWAVAGRILRPLATITAAARRISASNLHERLSLQGPPDELRALGETLDDLFARLEAAFEAQRQSAESLRHFVANASHELRTPLTRERAMLQVALDDPGTTTETWRSTTREVLASNAEQESLIEALLTLASSEGALDQREPVDLRAVTEGVLLAHGPDIDPLELQVKTSTGPGFFHGDPVLAERMVANLIGNAIRHNVPGGCVEVTTGSGHGRAVLSVSNTGPVIPPAEVGHLFRPFHRLGGRPARNGGHGLGLAIVAAIAAAHGAAIDAYANRGGGLTITITFPSPAPGRTSLAGSSTGQRSSSGGPEQDRPPDQA